MAKPRVRLGEPSSHDRCDPAPVAATAVLVPVLDGSAPVPPWTWLAHAFMLEAHGRTEAVARARALGLLAPSPSRRAP
jgi:hypothetical protein